VRGAAHADNLQRFGDFYAGSTLTYTLGESDELWALIHAWQQQQQQQQQQQKAGT
jgi:hypothetical protein